MMISISWPLLCGVPGGLWTCSIPKVIECVLFIAVCCCVAFISYKDECRDCGSKGVTVPKSSKSSDNASDALDAALMPLDILFALQPANEAGELSNASLLERDSVTSFVDSKSK